MIYVFSALYCLGLIVFITSLIALINPLLRKYKLKGDNPNVEHGLGDFIRDTFFYKKTFIIFLAAYNLLMSTGLYLNAGYTASCFIGILILALYFEMFQTKMPEDPTQIDGFENIGKYFNFKKNENGEFKCPDGKKVLPRWQANLKKKMFDGTGTGTETGTGTGTEPITEQGIKLEEKMNPLQQQQQQQGGSKPKSKVITKTGKIRQRYNVSLI